MDQPSAPPQRLLEGRFLLQSTLGKGGMGKVYRALDIRDDRTVAVKILHPDAVKHPNWRSRFLTEAEAMRKLQHPNIARVFHVGQDGAQLYYALELTESGSTYDMVSNRTAPRSPLWGLRVGFELLMALSCAHDHGIVHRDIKPANLLVTDRGVALTDFGLARMDGSAVAHRTNTGEELGTRGYMAPEQQRDAKSVGPAADLYSAAATIYALLSRRSPSNLSAADRDPKILEYIPPPVRPFMLRATERAPEDRYEGARAMAVALAEVRDQVAIGMGVDTMASRWMEEFDTLRRGEAPSRGEFFEEPTVKLVRVDEIDPSEFTDEVPPPPEPSRAPLTVLLDRPVLWLCLGGCFGVAVFAAAVLFGVL